MIQAIRRLSAHRRIKGRDRPGWAARFKALPADRRGATALEFAFLGPVFLLLCVMIFEVSLELFVQEIVDNATRNVARLIKIGTLNGSSYSTTLIGDICSQVVLVPSCTTAIKGYVAAAATGSPAGTGFDSISPAAISAGNFSSSYAALGANEDVVLEIGYQRPWWFSWLKVVTGQSSSWIVSVSVFQTEPYFTPTS